MCDEPAGSYAKREADRLYFSSWRMDWSSVMDDLSELAACGFIDNGHSVSTIGETVDYK